MLSRRVGFIKIALINEVKEDSDVFFANFSQKRDPFLDFIQPIPLYLKTDNELQEKNIQDSMLGGYLKIILIIFFNLFT